MRVLLLIPGGPGNPGLNRPSTHGRKLPPEVLDRYDIVGFDPRGVGQSTPVSCELLPQDAGPLGFLPWTGPGGDISGNVDRARRVAAACARNGGALMRHITTRNEARDIDRVRLALGERRLSYWGTSYGTYAGAVYAMMFPERTDRIVLDSSDDPHAAALKMRSALGDRARMVTVDSGGHGAYLANGNACGDRTVSTFLAHGSRPHHDTSCRP